MHERQRHWVDCIPAAAAVFILVVMALSMWGCKTKSGECGFCLDDSDCARSVLGEALTCADPLVAQGFERGVCVADNGDTCWQYLVGAVPEGYECVVTNFEGQFTGLECEDVQVCCNQELNDCFWQTEDHRRFEVQNHTAVIEHVCVEAP